MSDPYAELREWANRPEHCGMVHKQAKAVLMELANLSAEKYGWEVTAQQRQDDISALKKQVAQLDQIETQLIRERDMAEAVADSLAYAVAPIEVIGEHSSMNCPWQNALELVTSDETVCRLRLELTGEQKSNALLNAGMGSLAERYDELKHANRDLTARVAALEAALRPFTRGHEYADEELSHLSDLDDHSVNPYDPERSPKVGDCRRAAALLAAPQSAGPPT